MARGLRVIVPLQVRRTCSGRPAGALGQEQSVVFEEEKDQYVTSTGEVHKLVQNVHFGVIPGVAGPPAEPHESLSHAITFVQHKIIFHPTGVIQSGSAYLVDKDKQILYAVTVAVSGVSYVRLYKYDQQQWHLCT